MNLKDITTLSGKGGLFRIVKPARAGVVLEPLAEPRKRFVATANRRVSVLEEISLYTTDEDGAMPISEVLGKLHAQQEGAPVALDKQSPEADLHAFMSELVPEYDEERVYVSDIRKLVSWYNILLEHYPTAFKSVADEEDTGEATAAEESASPAGEDAPSDEATS